MEWCGGGPITSSRKTPELQGEIDRLRPWYHNLHLPGGGQTAPGHCFGDFPRWKWEQLAPFVPKELSGWRTLDIGCNAGFYSFELARRGAEVLAIDHDAHYLAQAEWAARQLDPERRITFRQCDVYSLAGIGLRFDLVLFLGVLYHLRYPMFALDTLARLEPRLLLVQTLTMPEDDISAWSSDDFGFAQRSRMSEPGWPKMAFIEGAFADDPSNWWAPNRACARAMLRSAGFQVLAEPGHEMFVCSGSRPRAHLFGAEQWDAVVTGCSAPTTPARRNKGS